jgi:putative hydrolase of the HAD superfamily
VTRRYRAVLFDLFGTVVHFRAHPRTLAFEWLADELTRTCPGMDFDGFVAALHEVSRELEAVKRRDHFEVPSRERFRRALARLDPAGAHDDAAERLSLVHMAHLTAQTELPPDHSVLLRELAGRYRTGLVSNFDHAPTARAILATHAVAGCFEVIVVSDEHGRRKPHPAIFAAALAPLGVDAGKALYVGDTHADDVVGALEAGLDVAWINRRGAEVPAPRPTHVLGALTDLRAVLGRGDS